MLNFSDKDRKLYTVFAFDNDRYYTDSLLELNKEQYLWLSLRSSHDHVWFLSVQENKKIDIMCFDDKPTNVELKSRKKLLGLKDPFEWFKEQSKQNGSQAFVMDKDSFRNLFSKKYCTVSDLQNITIVLVLRPKISDLIEILFEDYPLISPYSKYIEDLRKATDKDIIFKLCNTYSMDCFFTQTFTRERLRNLLMYVMFADKKKALSAKYTEHMAVYLEYYLNNKNMQWEDNYSILKSIPLNKIITCRDIKKALYDNDTWKSFEEKVRYIYSLDSSDAEKAVRLYAEEKGLFLRTDNIIFMSPISNSNNEYYLSSEPSRYNIKTDDIPKSIKKYVFESYERLYRRAMTESGLDENEKCVEKLTELITTFCNIRQTDHTLSKFEKYFRYLICIDKCTDSLYKNEDEAEKDIRVIDSYLKAVNDLFEHMTDWDNIKNDEAEKILEDMDRHFCKGTDRELINKAIDSCNVLIRTNTPKTTPFSCVSAKVPKLVGKWGKLV